MAIIVRTRNKREEMLVKEFLASKDILFITELEEDQAIYKAMVEGKKSPLLSEAEKERFLRKLSKKR